MVWGCLGSSKAPCMRLRDPWTLRRMSQPCSNVHNAGFGLLWTWKTPRQRQTNADHLDEEAGPRTLLWSAPKSMPTTDMAT